jgi:hypothetical protein
MHAKSIAPLPRTLGLPQRPRPTYPALAAWRAELAAGKRTATTFDDLWRAACAEQSAIEFEQDGLPGRAEKFRAEAREIIRQAAAAKKRGAA